MMTETEFDAQVWIDKCEQLSKQAVRGDGCSYDWFVERFSREVEIALSEIPEDYRVQALQIAANQFDYETPAERAKTRQENSDNGCCMHGIELGCCPAGCGSGPDD